MTSLASKQLLSYHLRSDNHSSREDVNLLIILYRRHIRYVSILFNMSVVKILSVKNIYFSEIGISLISFETVSVEMTSSLSGPLLFCQIINLGSDMTDLVSVNNHCWDNRYFHSVSRRQCIKACIRKARTCKCYLRWYNVGLGNDDTDHA